MVVGGWWYWQLCVFGDVYYVECCLYCLVGGLVDVVLQVEMEQQCVVELFVYMCVVIDGDIGVFCQLLFFVVVEYYFVFGFGMVLVVFFGDCYVVVQGGDLLVFVYFCDCFVVWFKWL